MSRLKRHPDGAPLPPPDLPMDSDLGAWGTRAPVERQVPWNNGLQTVLIRGTQREETLAIKEWAAENFGEAERDVAEATATLAYAIIAVNGKRLDDEWPDWDAKFWGIARWDETLCDILSLEYVAVAVEPLNLYKTMRAEAADFGAAPLDSGASASGAVSTDAPSPAANSPSAGSTRKRMSARSASARSAAGPTAGT